MVFSNHLVRHRECRSSRRLLLNHIDRGHDMRVPRHTIAFAGCILLVAAGLITGYVWQRNGSGKMVANLQSAPVGDMGVTYVTWGGEVVLIVWKDFALS
jgi:hypothetical protein